MENENVVETAEVNEPGAIRVSPSARKLAERYGVAPEVMEEIISDTRSQARVRPTPTPSVIVTPPAVLPLGASMAAVPPPTVQQSTFPQPPLAQPAPPVVNTVVSTPLVEPGVVDRDNGMSVGAVILGVLLILALVLFFYFRPWSETLQTKSIDTTREIMQPAPKDTAIAEVLPPTDSVDHSKDLPAVKVPKSRHRTKHTAKQHYYTTSSDLQAEEHLADLKASGNTSAYLETVQKGGNTYYRLHTSRKRR